MFLPNTFLVRFHRMRSKCSKPNITTIDLINVSYTPVDHNASPPVVLSLHHRIATEYGTPQASTTINNQDTAIAIPKDVLLMLVDKDTAKEAWETLHTMHMGADRVKEAKVQTLRSDFEVIRMKDSESVDEFAMRLNTIITVWGLEEHDSGRGCGSSQDSRRETLRTDERDSSNAPRGRGGSSSRGRGRGRGRECGRGRGDGHDPKTNWNDQKHVHKDKRKIKCFACEEFGHYASECSKKGDHSKFHELDEYVLGRVNFGDGSMVAIMGKGSVLFDCKNGLLNERRNRTVMEMAMSLLKGRNVPGEFWGEAVRHAVYLLNRLPSKSLPDITPYEAWYGKKPNLEHLKTFGCIVFAKHTCGHLKKLDDRGKNMVYLGVEDGTKENRLYDPQERKLRVSRDVLFDEKKRWDWCKSMEDDRPVTNTFTIIKPPLETPQHSPKTTHNQQDPEFETVVSGQPYPEDVQADLDPNNAALDPFSSPSTDSSNSSNAIGPRGFRSLDDIYDRTHEVTLQPEELMMVETDQPSTFEEAVNFKAWREAMQAELDAIEKYKIWELTDLPPGEKPIGLKWVYKVKKDNLGNVVKYKARLVVKRYVQKQGVDYYEVFALVARLDTKKLILALAAQHGWVVHHLDVKSAFLNKDLKEEVYVTQLEDKSMNGLGFLKSSQDLAVYTRNLKGKTRIVGVYVDDLIITGSYTHDIVEFKEQMKNEFEMSDLGLLAYYRGIEVSQKKWGITLRQTAYAKKILDWNCKPFYEKPTTLHFRVVKRILRYIRGTLDYGINYEKGSEFKELVGFTDSDHGGDVVSGKSTSGMIFYLGRNVITWQSQKQKSVALSSCEAEFMAATGAACQAIWLANLVKELTGHHVAPIKLYVDNKSDIALIKNHVFHGRSKHINIRFHFIRECVEDGLIIVEHVSSKDQRADIFTKAMAQVDFINKRNVLGVTNAELGPV
uniref:CCHC-type domain-containing protein n=1 Tax=Tanacetum cinerariifolium TaxID=118510 RepID=A0A699GW69_TANCI|nr:hypothetical protein [Tanacetum cinerariifolium]